LEFTLPLAEMRLVAAGIPGPWRGECSTRNAASGEIRAFEQQGLEDRHRCACARDGNFTSAATPATRDGARMKLLVEQWRP
jgi:hypothetical protein